MGRRAGECESHLGENGKRVSRIQSICGHVESAEKTGGPSSKPKYYPMTDSGEVP